MRTLLIRVPKAAQTFVATMVRSIFAQPDAGTVLEQHARIVEQLAERFRPRPSSWPRRRPTCSPSRTSRSSAGAS
jgi:transposase-like protein